MRKLTIQNPTSDFWWKFYLLVIFKNEKEMILIIIF